jgi:hypothetical protein
MWKQLPGIFQRFHERGPHLAIGDQESEWHARTVRMPEKAQGEERPALQRENYG